MLSGSAIRTLVRLPVRWPTSPALVVGPRPPASPDRGECTATDQCNTGDDLPAPAIGYTTLGRCWRGRRLSRWLPGPWLLCNLLALSLRAVCAGALRDVRLSHHASFRVLLGNPEVASDPRQVRLGDAKRVGDTHARSPPSALVRRRRLATLPHTETPAVRQGHVERSATDKATRA